MADGNPQEQVQRLTDMVVEEVSLVDRAANKRRFLLVKRSRVMENATEVVPDGKGGFKSVEKKDGEQAPAQPTTPAGEPAAPPAPEAPAAEPVEKAGEAGKKLQDAVGRLMSVSGKVRGGEDPAKFADEIKAAVGLLNAITEKYPSLQAKADEPTPAVAPVEKSGAKMRKDRLERLKGAVKALSDLVGELEPEEAPTGQPSAGCAEATTKKDEAPAAEPPVAPVPAAPVPDERLEKLAKSVEGLAKVVQVQGEALSKLPAMAPPSNALPVEKRGEEQEGADVSWPQDMNRRLDRAAVGKDISFHDV